MFSDCGLLGVFSLEQACLMDLSFLLTETCFPSYMSFYDLMIPNIFHFLRLQTIEIHLAPLTCTFRSCDSALSDPAHPISVPSCCFRMRSSRHQLPLGLMPLPPYPCSMSVFASIQPRNFVTRIAFLVSWSDLVPSSLSTFDAFSCRIKPKLLNRAPVAPPNLAA